MEGGVETSMKIVCYKMVQTQKQHGHTQHNARLNINITDHLESLHLHFLHFLLFFFFPHSTMVVNNTL